jgi:flagellar motor switch protein FliG
LSGIRKAAILLVLLGDEAASLVYRNLPEEDLQMLTEEISELEYISPETGAQILQEYYRLTVTEEYLAQGGADYARTLLVKAFGEDGAKHCSSRWRAIRKPAPQTWTPCKGPIPSNS